jgi:hypothetical protein
MKNRPVFVIMVAILFLLAGGIVFVYHVTDLSDPNIDRLELVWVLIVRILALVCAVLLLLRKNWARWLAIAWLLYHVVLSAFHSLSETIIHTILLILITIILFHPISTAYFKKR